MAVRWITRGCIAVFIGGIAGLIISSIAGNNNGIVLTLGSAIGLAAIVLIVTSTVASSIHGRDRIDVFVEAENERMAERLEAQIHDLVASGADETAVRALVRDVMRLDRR